MAPYATPEDLREALVGAGLLHLTSVDGVTHRSATWERVIHGMEQHAVAERLVDAPQRWFPPVMPRTDFMRTDYVRSFPDLVGSIDVFTGSDKDHRALLAVLCHSLYGVLPAEVPADGLLHECGGWVFRHEPSTDPARMQAFRMYEFVRIGTPAQALEHRDAWLERGLAVLAGLGLPVRSEAANDPFFGRVGRMLAANQRESELKYEIVVDLTDAKPTAIASSNLHEDHFGEPFGLRTPDGSSAHSACFGYGLDRIALALFATHGTDVAAWPVEVRSALSC
jgi:seryl-tRNA synthetase